MEKKMQVCSICGLRFRVIVGKPKACLICEDEHEESKEDKEVEDGSKT